MRIAEGATARVNIEAADLHSVLGAKQFESEIAMRMSTPGVATGLAWTPVGGDILFVEATRVPGSGKLILTGQLGKVMKESAQAALSLVKSRAARSMLQTMLSTTKIFTSMSRRGRYRKTVRALVSPCSSRSLHW